MKIRCFYLLGLLLVSIHAAAQSNRLVTLPSDLVGCWSMIPLSDELKRTINEIDIGDPQYQWLCFEADGTLRTFSSTDPMDTKASELHSSLSVLPKVISYEIVRPGLVVITRSDVHQSFGWIANFTPGDITLMGTIIPKNSLAMGLIDRSKNKGVYWRYLIKMNESE